MKSAAGQRKPLFQAIKGRWLPLMLLGIGMVLIALQFLTNIFDYMKAPFIRVEHPVSYDFTAYNRLLERCVQGELVDYRSLVKAPELYEAVTELEHISPDRMADPRQQLAFWINTYNLLVIRNVAEKYPIKSPRAVERDLSLHKFLIGGKPYSVADVEARKIRPMLMHELPQALFLMCGGAMGHPPLLDHAIDAVHLEEEANLNAYRFVNNPRNVFLDLDTNTLFISPFFKWNEEIYARQFGTPFALVNFYLAPMSKMEISNQNPTRRIMGIFNWWLNDTAQSHILDHSQTDRDNSDGFSLPSGGE